MMMEPDEHQPEYRQHQTESRVVYARNRRFPAFQTGPRVDQEPIYSLPLEPIRNPHNPHFQNQEPAEQNFFPNFFRAPQHNRQYNGLNNAAAIAGRYSTAARTPDQSILGSGDFSVISGGTYYPEGELRSTRPKNEGYHGNTFGYNNGHGRPNAQAFSGRPHHQDPFSNFRDFADINSGSDPAYSHFVVVYANKNSTTHHPNPKNIFEQLQLLDQEDQEKKEAISEEPEEKYSKKPLKLSKFKTKLAKTKFEKKYQKKLSPKESLDQYSDPLLAES